MIKNPSEKDAIYLENVAKIGNSAENILYIENILSEDEHAILLNFVKTRDEWNDEPWLAKTVRSGQMPEEISKILHKVFTLFYEKAKTFYDVEVDFFIKDRVTLFKFVEGFALPLHVDILSDEALHIASVYYINDDYTGGEINFPDHNIKIKPKSNSLVIFPGNENYQHEVLKIVNGNRFSSALWLKFTGSTFYEQKEWYNYK